MADHRIVHIALDERTILWRNADVEQERRVAIYDLLEGNSFEPVGMAGDGPWALMMRIEDGRLAMDVRLIEGEPEESALAAVPLAGTIRLSLAPFRRTIREYFAICDSYYKAIHGVSRRLAIETIDMARRGVHDEAAALLVTRLKGKANVDFDTARRLFTLICVLHIR